MRKFSLIILGSIIVTFVHAQHTKQKGGFSVSAQAALLNGDNHVNGQILLSAGYELHGWFIGAGSGFDYYKYRTVPAFVDIKKYFGKGNRQLFIYANGGTDIAWPTEKQENLHRIDWMAFHSDNKFKNGLYTDFGFGYTLFNSQRRGFFTAIGYSAKTMSETYNELVWNGATSVIAKRTLNYSMNRILLRVGYKF
jgi:hypothetical protein